MRVQFGQIEFDSETRQVTRAGEALHIPPKAFHLLQILIEKRPSAVSREELMERLWPDVVVEEANLKNLVSEIRAALGNAQCIRTVRGFGYAFTSEAPSGSAGILVTKDHFYRLQSGENTIGRSQRCEVILDVFGVSRKHARIIVSDDGATLEDLDSKNGTLLNGVKLLSSAVLKPGDQITIGVTELIYRIGTDEETTASLEHSRRS